LNASSVSSLLESSVSWTATVPLTSTVQVEVSLNNGGSWAVATNGGEVPGTTVGMNMAGMTDVLTRVTMTSGAHLTGTVMTSLSLSFLDADDQELLYAPQEFIGESLDDRSVNDVDAAVSYPVEGPFIVNVGPFVPVEPATIVVVEPGASDIIQEIEEPDNFAEVTGSGLSDVPLFGVLIAHWATFVGVEAHVAWAWFIGGAMLVLGGLTGWFTKSITMGGGVMAVGTLFASNLALESPIPLWGVLFAGIGIVGVLVWLDRR
jgi:hypothetical protein